LINRKVLFKIQIIFIYLESISVLDVDNILKHGPFEYNRIKFVPERFQDEGFSTAILLKNVETEEEVDILMLLFESEPKTGGGKIEKHEYNASSKQLVLFYQESFVAERVLNFGPIKFKTKTYIPIKFEGI
jgi:hypothetical protein